MTLTDFCLLLSLCDHEMNIKEPLAVPVVLLFEGESAINWDLFEFGVGRGLAPAVCPILTKHPFLTVGEVFPLPNIPVYTVGQGFPLPTIKVKVYVYRENEAISRGRTPPRKAFN